jgi:outer membrane protein
VLRAGDLSRAMSALLAATPVVEAGLRIFVHAIAVLLAIGSMSADSVRAETLPEAWSHALRVDHRLAASRQAISAAEMRSSAAAADRWPQLSVETGYTVRDNEPSFRFIAPSFVGPSITGPLAFPYAQRDSFAAGATAAVPLYTSGRITHQIDAAQARLSSEHAESERTELAVKMAVADAYVGVLRARQVAAVAHQSLENMLAHERDVAQMFANEVVPQTDLLAAQVARSQARYREIQALSNLDQACATFNRQLGRPLDADVSLVELPLAPLRDELDSLTDRAWNNRRELVSLAAQAQSLRHQADATRAMHAPQVELRGSYAFAENDYQTPEGLASAGIVLQYNVFDAGRKRYSADADSFSADRVLLLHEDQKLQIALEVRQAWLAAREAHSRIEVAREAVKQAAESLRVSRLRYAQGVGTNTEVLNAETRHVETARDSQLAVYDYVLATIRLRYVTGDLDSAVISESPPTEPVRRLPPLE